MASFCPRSKAGFSQGQESPCQESPRLHFLEQRGQQGPAQEAATHSHWASKLEAAQPGGTQHVPPPSKGPHTCFHTNGFARGYAAHKSHKSGHYLSVLRGCIKLMLCRCVSCNLSIFCPSITNQRLLPSALKNYYSVLPRPVSFQGHTINPKYYTVQLAQQLE